ncbi:MAG: tRNA (adenosine(37)-N6)-threonylcarbamoyltransferase complex ATPase subunit type 1 TsaE [Muribaculaceae bacterium]|nr:tRNA (adenosine(37)-N6)-threonylcarbamoyltransferase complex ATPase subunit type 1 TsaE [Muribaculaceae bacterium]
MRIIIPDENALPEAAARLAEAIGPHRLVAFDGPMGAGKTTLISALCRHLGMADEASSPTFSIVNEYRAADGSEKIYHFDFYRLEGPADAMEIGVDDYFTSGSLCLMEWAENIGPALPEETLTVTITPQRDGSRVVSV